MNGVHKRELGYCELLSLIIGSYRKIKKTPSKRGKRRIYSIIIGGCARAGKTKLSQQLLSDIKAKGISAFAIELDNWLMSIEKRKGHETVRERYSYDKITHDIKKIISGAPVVIPSYDPRTRKTVYDSSRAAISINGGICIIDGVISLDIAGLRSIADLSVYVEVPDKIRKKRLWDFYIKYKGLDEKETKEMLKKREREEVLLVKSTKKYAQIIYTG